MIVSVVALTITGVLSFNYADQILTERASEQLLGESTVRGETLRLLFESRIEQNSILANDPMIQILVSEMNQVSDEELKSVKDQNRRDFLIQVQAFQELIGFSIGFEDVKVVGANGNVFFSLVGAKDENFLENPMFQRGLAEPYIEFEPSAGGKKMIVVSPVFAEDSKIGDDPIGVIISRMRTAAIDSVLVNRSGLGETGEVYIVNERFEMLSESRFIEDAVFQIKVDTLGVQKCFNEGKEHLGLYNDYRGIPIYGSSYCARDLGIVLLAEIDEAEVAKPIGILENRIMLTGIVITIVMGGIAFVISKSLSRPLNKLKNAANNIASGNFDVRTNINTRDEIGELSDAFDSMAQKLQDSLIEIKEKEDVIKQQEEILLKFSQHSQNDCVGVIDMKDSTKISAQLSEEEFSKMYEIFLNFMARIIREYNGQVVKSIGDALMFRFPDIKSNDSAGMRNVVECCLSMLDNHEKLKQELASKSLPELNYKISATYGSVKVAESATSNIADIFGPTVNRCFKINSLCPKNSLVVGINLYEALRDMPDYAFTELSITEMKQKYGYEIFEVRRSENPSD